MKAKHNFTEIGGHDVRWHVESKSITELSDFEQERIADLLKEGYSSGEICMSYMGRNGQYYETRGWWEVVKWKNIACDLYHALNNAGLHTEKAKEAIKNFNDNWN